MAKEYIKSTETENGTFYYLDFGDIGHGRTCFRLWIHYSFVKRDENDNPYIEFPLKNAKIDQGKKKKTLILRPGNHNIFKIFVSCGYRGGAKINIKTPVISTFDYCRCESPRGSLGVSTGCLVVTDEDHVTYEWKRTGRLYGADPSGTTTIDIDGNKEVLENVDICEIEDLVEV